VPRRYFPAQKAPKVVVVVAGKVEKRGKAGKTGKEAVDEGLGRNTL